MNRSFHILIDDRGLSRALLENWVPALDPDVIWFIGDSDPEPDLLHDIVPVVPMSPLEPGAALAELRALANETRVVAIFESIDHLVRAVQFRLTPQRVILVNLRGHGERLSAQVMVSPEQSSQLKNLQQKGFDFQLQPLPNVTSRGLRPVTATAESEP